MNHFIVIVFPTHQLFKRPCSECRCWSWSSKITQMSPMSLSQTHTHQGIHRLRRLRRLRSLWMLWKNSKEERRLRKLGLKSWLMLLWESRNGNSHQVRNTLQAATYHHCNRTVVSISQGILKDQPDLQQGYACCGLGSPTGSRLFAIFWWRKRTTSPIQSTFPWLTTQACGWQLHSTSLAYGGAQGRLA